MSDQSQSDLHLLAGLLCELKQARGYERWSEVEISSPEACQALQRLRGAVRSGEVDGLEVGLGEYLR